MLCTTFNLIHPTTEASFKKRNSTLIQRSSNAHSHAVQNLTSAPNTRGVLDALAHPHTLDGAHSTHVRDSHDGARSTHVRHSQTLMGALAQTNASLVTSMPQPWIKRGSTLATRGSNCTDQPWFDPGYPWFHLHEPCSNPGYNPPSNLL